MRSILFSQRSYASIITAGKNQTENIINNIFEKGDSNGRAMIPLIRSAVWILMIKFRSFSAGTVRIFPVTLKQHNAMQSI